MGLQKDWSTTAATNATADATINLREGQAPSTVNDSVRALMRRVAQTRKDNSGEIITGGGSTAYTLATNEVLASLVDGMRVTARMHVTSGVAPTLNVDGLGAKPIQSAQSTAIATGVLIFAGVYEFMYCGGGDSWIAVGYYDVPLQVPDASESTKGKVELATTAEATTGTDTARAVTPAGVKANVDAAVLALRNGVDAAYDTLAELAAGLAAVQALIPGAASQADMEAASSNTAYATPGRLKNHPGVAKAWFNYNLSTQTVVASFGITSITRTGAGLFTVTFSTAFADANYIAVGFCRWNTGAGSAVMSAVSGGTKTTTQIALEAAGGAGLIDATEVTAAFFGDQ